MYKIVTRSNGRVTKTRFYQTKKTFDKWWGEHTRNVENWYKGRSAEAHVYIENMWVSICTVSKYEKPNE